MQVQLTRTATLVSLILAGCATTAPSPPVAEPLPQPMRAAEHAAGTGSGRGDVPCPTDLRGTVVFATPLEDGAAMLFIAPPGPKVDELRRRVQALAARAPSEAGGPIAAADDIESGARLKLTPRRPDGIDDVQRNVFDYAQRLAGATCPLVRDELSHPEGTTAGTDHTLMPVPPGIIPGVGGLAGPAVPSFGPAF